MHWLSPITETQQQHYIALRDNETKLGQQVQFFRQGTDLRQYPKSRYAIVGVPEDIGPRANCGLGGADLGWDAFLRKFLNFQANDFLPADEILIAGAVHCEDIQNHANELDSADPEQLQQLRKLCQELDTRVARVVGHILEAGLFPIIIGGGHNNAYGAIKALYTHHRQPVACVNLDPHSDFRPHEGRHSGNGFSYAHHENMLAGYYVIGLHEQKNSAANIQLLREADYHFASYQQIWSRREIAFSDVLKNASQYMRHLNTPVGLELDVDAIAFMPASAYTNCGIPFQDAEHYVYQLAKTCNVGYLHLAEGAPARHPCGIDAGRNDVGQGLAGLVCAFIQGHKQN